MNYLKTHLKLYIFGITAVAVFAITSCNSPKNDSKQSSPLQNQQQTMEQNNLVNIETEANMLEDVSDAEENENQNVASSVSENAEQPAPVQNNAEVMLNPPHGEPFHRCDIPVGAPLNSPPASTARRTTNNAVQTPTAQSSGSAPTLANNPTAPTIENAMRMNSTQTRNTAPANSGTKPRLNPPHGQPWHRCDIAVGSPLP